MSSAWFRPPTVAAIRRSRLRKFATGHVTYM